MSQAATGWIALCAVATGCTTAQPTSRSPAATSGNLASDTTVTASPATAKSPRVATTTERAVELPAFEVRDSAFSDFGMSIKTNLAVKWGDHVEWMEVIAIEPGSSAEKQGLRPSDRILALDDQLVNKLDRDAMLAALFQRKSGERTRALVFTPGDGLPRFVSLVASRPGVAAR